MTAKTMNLDSTETLALEALIRRELDKLAARSCGTRNDGRVYTRLLQKLSR